MIYRREFAFVILGFFSSRFANTLLLGLLLAAGARAVQFQPLLDLYGNHGANEDCALVLDGPGRSSLYDYTYNLLRGGHLYV